jgi:hypothetical protein
MDSGGPLTIANLQMCENFTLRRRRRAKRRWPSCIRRAGTGQAGRIEVGAH